MRLWQPATRFSFQREARWIVVLYFLIPLIGIIAAVVVPAIARWWQG